MNLPTGTFRSHTDSAYRCDSCRCLLNAPKGKDGDRCPVCETGQLRLVHRITQRMVIESEQG